MMGFNSTTTATHRASSSSRLGESLREGDNGATQLSDRRLLEAELADTKLLQNISAALIENDNVEAIYAQIMEAAVAIMRSQYASMQMLYPERGEAGELLLLAHRGFDPQAAKTWEWVSTKSSCTCGLALKTGERFIASDVATCKAMAGTADQANLLKAGIRAAQSTPLISRNGQLIGMITTHWSQPHEPSERDLRLMDILARQAADLIERKKAERTLRESEERLRSIFTQTLAGIAETDLSGRFVHVNDRYCEIVGRTAEELYGLRMQDITHSDDLTRNLSLFKQAVTDGVPFNIEKRYLRPDGSLVWVHNSVSLVRDGTGTPRHIAAVSIDISDRKEAELALRQSEERSRLLSDALAQLLARPDPDLVVRELFPRVAKHLDVDTYFNFMVNDDGDALYLHACAGVSEQVAHDIRRLEFGQAICGTVAQTRCAITATDIQHTDYDKADLVRSMGIQVYACNPLMVGDRLIGTLSFASRSRTNFDAGELEFMRQIAQYVAVAMDRTRTLAKVRESEERFRAFTNATSDVVYSMSADWSIMRRLDGREFIADTLEPSTTWLDKYIHADDQRRVMKAIRRAIDTKTTFELEHRVIRVDGSLGWTYSRAIPILDERGEIIEWFGAASDITKRKEAEEALRRREALLAGQRAALELAVNDAPLHETLVQLVHIAIDQFGPDSRAAFYLANEEGTCLHHVVGMCDEYAKTVDGFPIGADSLACGLAVHTGQPQYTADVKEEPKWERWLWMAEKFDYRACWSIPIHSIKGTFMGTLAVYFHQPRPATTQDIELCTLLTQTASVIVSRYRDSEARSKIEETLRQHRESLEETVKQRTDEALLAQQRLAMSQRMAAVGTLASGLAHDMGNLLLPLGMRLEALLKHQRIEADVHNELVIISALLDHLRDLSKNLSLFSRDPEKEGIFGRTNIAQWCSAVQKLLDASVGREIIVKWDCPESLPEIALAPHRLTQAVQNLIHNARDAVLAAKARNPQHVPRICVQARPTTENPSTASTIAIIVSDNGIGMDDDVKRRCIEPFFTTRDRPNEPSTPGIGGSGLGLSLAHQIAERADGTMDIESNPGKGTSITLTIPIAPRRSA